MAQLIRPGARRRQGESPDRQESRTLREGLLRTQQQINQAYACFNQVSDPDLIESYVFEIKALQCRYTYLLRRIRELESAPLLPAAEA